MKPKTGRDLCPKAPHAKSLRIGSSLCQNGQTQNDQTKPNQARDREPVEEDAGCSLYDPKPKKLTLMHGDDDQIVPYADAGPLSAKLLKNGTLKTYKGFPHGMPTTQADTINADLLAFLKA
jgi:pimeloyl-ACP methyl ester carboxylesterase